MYIRSRRGDSSKFGAPVWCTSIVIRELVPVAHHAPTGWISVAREVNSPDAVNNYRLFQDPPPFAGASTLHSSLTPRINKPAGIGPPAHRLEV
jgi:hypothetical protein